MKNKLAWIFLLLIIFVGLTLYFKQTHIAKEQTLIDLLNQQYDKKFTLKTWLIGNFLITSANSNTTCCGDGSSDPYDEKATPIIAVQDLNNQEIKSIYEVSFTTNAADGKFDKGNIIWVSKTAKVKDYFVGEWGISWGGSSGMKGMIIFSNENGQFQPIVGYPLKDDKDSINVTDKRSGKKYSFPVTGDSNFSEVEDLNNDGIIDLLFADWEWKDGEGHYQARPWNLQVFELADNKFSVAKWWNKGEVYKTPENIGYFNESDTLKLRQIFYEKSN